MVTNGNLRKTDGRDPSIQSRIPSSTQACWPMDLALFGKEEIASFLPYDCMDYGFALRDIPPRHSWSVPLAALYD